MGTCPRQVNVSARGDLSAAVAAFIAAPSVETPHSVHDKITDAFIDVAACVVAGERDPVTQVALGFARSRYGGGAGPCSLFFGAQQAQPAVAAMINAVASHALDFDDFAFASHPSTILVPAILAESERTDGRCGDLREAYAIGYEVWYQLTQRLRITIHDRGWHPTSVLGTVCATASLCAMRGYDVGLCRHALGLASGFASGLVANFGSMGKSLQVGMAVERALAAVDLAGAGGTGAENGLDALLKALTGLDLDSVHAGWSVRQWAVLTEGPRLKKYPTCYATHRIIDALLDRQHHERIDCDAVTGIHAEVSATALGVMKHRRPIDETQARFSLEFAVACALTRNRVTLADFGAEVLFDAQVRRLMDLMTVEVVEERCPVEPAFALHDRVRIHTSTGTYDSGPLRYARGHGELPLRVGELDEKLQACCGSVERAKAVREQVEKTLDRPTSGQRVV
jgi:aconitate decarboxylase